MEENLQPKPQREFVFSKAVKAGKRIYYFDVRKTRNEDDVFVSVTESKKVANGGTQEAPQFLFQKQKMTIYREDLKNFTDALNEIAAFVEQVKIDENIENKPFNRQNFDNSTPEKQNFNQNVFSAEKEKTMEKPIEKREKSSNKFKALFDNIFSDI